MACYQHQHAVERTAAYRQAAECGVCREGMPMQHKPDLGVLDCVLQGVRDPPVQVQRQWRVSVACQTPAIVRRACSASLSGPCWHRQAGVCRACGVVEPRQPQQPTQPLVASSS